MNYNQIAEQLDRAARQVTPTSQISTQQTLSLQEAYAIQSISMGKRYQRGEKWVGMKLGFTSRAKMEQMGIHDMIWGRLTDKMALSKGGELHLQDFIHPRAEPEIAFRLKKQIDQPLELAQIGDFVDGVAVALEVIDSRYKDFKFSLEDVIADNCSSAAFCIGEWHKADTEIEDISMELLIDGAVQHSGNSNAILGNPWESLIAAARLAYEYGEKLPAGAIILAGAATPAVYLTKGQTVKATAAGMGEVHFKMV